MTEKTTVGTTAGAIPLTITIKMLTSKRMFFALITALGMIAKYVWGYEIDEQTKTVAVNEAVRLGATAAEIIGLLGIAFSKYLDERKP